VEQRRLGRTGHESSVAVLGGAACWAATPEQAGEWLRLALSRGVNHLDIAPQYGAAESVVGPHLAARRDELFIAGKTLRANPDGVVDQFDTTRRLLHAEVLDLYQAHAVTSLAELDRRSPALERIVALRDAGHTRFAGITGHDLEVPLVHLEALRRFDLDTVMFPVYPGLWARPEYREPAEQLLAVCADRDIGVMAIKAVAHRPWADRRPDVDDTNAAGATKPDAPAGDEDTAVHWADSWYEPVRSDATIDRGVHFALSTPGVHAFCTPGDIPLLPRVLDAADRYAGMDEEARRAAVDAMAGEQLIFPMPR
jgi:aryl-alcohol dehydrogenase-like predicted oxidoreductase